MMKVDACNRRGVCTYAANENEIPSRRLLSSRGETTLLREGAALSVATVRNYSLFPAILPTPIFSYSSYEMWFESGKFFYVLEQIYKRTKDNRIIDLSNISPSSSTIKLIFRSILKE